MATTSQLTDALDTLPGLPPPRRELLARLGLLTIGDLLFHFPRAYEDLTDLRPIAKLSAGKLQTVRGEVVEVGGTALNDGRTVVSVVISDDGRSILEGSWFNQPYVSGRFRYGQRVSFSGKPKRYRGHWSMSNPRVQWLEGDASNEPGIVPVYPLTEELRPEHLRPLIRRALDRCTGGIVDRLPESLRARHGWPVASQALRDLHFPSSLDAALEGRGRFIYEELLVLQLALALRRRESRDRQRAPRLTTTPLIDERIRKRIPFSLTGDQNRAIAEIARDLSCDRPMQRLLQADVGAGKTAVAVYALLVAVANKHQAALMAPTEVLARQHAQTLDRYLSGSRVRRLLLTGGLPARERRQALSAIRQGDVDLVIGTQALVQEDVCFARLGLVVVDEQHRFGVHQRARFRKLGVDPHYLVMTATPIPRTIALTVFGDLDVSIMREMPPGRQPVRTRWVQERRRETVYSRLRELLKEGRQAFVVCPLVEESVALDAKAATQSFDALRDGPFRDFRVGLLHGRLEDAAKQEVMDQFRERALDLLVCTSVVEVGVDVPNATVMVIEQAERFGLSQLHQLRGRVSRGESAGECYLFATPTTDEARERLRIVTVTSDGFRLAEEDARLRGVGEFFGARQHGGGGMRFADLATDLEVLDKARADAFAIVAEDARLSRPEHRLLREAVVATYGATLELAEVG